MTIEPSTSVQNVKDRVLETRAVLTDRHRRTVDMGQLYSCRMG